MSSKSQITYLVATSSRAIGRALGLDGIRDEGGEITYRGYVNAWRAWEAMLMWGAEHGILPQDFRLDRDWTGTTRSALGRGEFGTWISVDSHDPSGWTTEGSNRE